MRCAILIASKSVVLHTVEGIETRCNYIGVSQLISASSNLDMNSVFHQLKEFISVVPLSESTILDMKRLIKSFAVSFMTFKKFEEVWRNLDLQGSTEHLKQMFEFAWLSLISVRANLLQRTDSIFVCACLIIGILHIILCNLPPNISASIPRVVLLHLCTLMQAKKEQVFPWIERISNYMLELKAQGIIKGKGENLSGILTRNVLSSNKHNLYLYYQRTIGINDIDERDYLGSKSVSPVKTRGLTPLTRRNLIRSLNGKGLP